MTKPSERIIQIAKESEGTKYTFATRLLELGAKGKTDELTGWSHDDTAIIAALGSILQYLDEKEDHDRTPN